ncbi:hypothetical protein COT87_02465 [Candidatus Collierbacteria bacterium CG10_big_fil_rev_8_21_14_0_10_44_9]|uniref:DUF5680 domain-containing protein n=1 Tax=Candidatus Collierbacteria bacterium CG10_big_fil_rev_8_21_14_0_10_44_9 TaxID=1974535 RepID=A0A2H0VIE9_9BACT|nr:MAG: hypothetical protein COT87_02465 [Candidatus Collierbacteria bacterium CG10_big_fil_rev_8_21_14_0_10_44_9]
MSINNLKETQGFFFEMMLAGYTSKEEPEKFFQFDGHKGTKRFSYQKAGGWHGIDEWEHTSGEWSKGTTLIYKDGRPVWQMDYWGYYPKECIPFLKKALAKNYRERLWLGGRGPNIFELPNESWFYSNSTFVEHDFHEFLGRDFIVDKVTRKEVGWHRYTGSSFLKT